MVSGEALFVSLYWIALFLYVLLVWCLPSVFRGTPGLPDLHLRRFPAETRWVAWALHLVVAFMPIANLIATVALLLKMVQLIHVSYALRRGPTSGP